jgi:hypothetical protein
MANTLIVDGSKIDQVLNDITKLITGLDKNTKTQKSRREKNLINKITEIRTLIQNAVLDAKLKKSIKGRIESISYCK